MTNAILYARFSPRPSGEDCLSIETQLDRCRQLTAAKAWEVLAWHEDRELSGGRADNRPGLQAALDDACKHKAVLVCYSLSRLARNTHDAIEISERLDKCGANFFSLSESIDTTSPTGRFTFTLFAALATLEREQIGERTSDAMQRHQEAGRRMTRKDRLPFGWKLHPENNLLTVKCEEEQKTIEEIKALHKDGWAMRSIAEKLGCTCRGKRWHHPTIRSILLREM